MITTVTRVITKLLIRWGGWWRAGDSLDNGLSNHSTQLHSVHRCWRHSYVFWSQSAFIWVITSNLWAVSAGQVSTIHLIHCPAPSNHHLSLLQISSWCHNGTIGDQLLQPLVTPPPAPAASGLLFFPFSPVLSLALIRLCSLHKCPVFTIQTASKILWKLDCQRSLKGSSCVTMDYLVGVANVPICTWNFTVYFAAVFKILGGKKFVSIPWFICNCRVPGSSVSQESKL